MAELEQNENPCANCQNCPAKSVDVTRVRDNWLWVRDARGYGSVTLTFVTVAFWVTTLSYIVSILHKIGPVEFRPFDVGACAAFYGMTLGTYVSRKFTEAKYSTNS